MQGSGCKWMLWALVMDSVEVVLKRKCPSIMNSGLGPGVLFVGNPEPPQTYHFRSIVRRDP